MIIQNADDARATKVCLCLNHRNHRTDSLLSDKLAQWQGPALLAYNDAVLSEDDFVSISRIGGSGKHGQAWKTDRFGIKSWKTDYVSSSAISLYKDQFSPYCAFGCDMEGPLDGTLFRFPLRNADQAANSKLSKQGYLEDDISSMLVQLYEEGVFSLLFLKSVLSIEMYEWDVGLAEPRKTYSCSVNSGNGDTIWHRQALLRLSKLTDSNESFVDTFSLEFLSEAVNGSHPQKRTDTFYIVQRLSSPSSRIGAFAAKASKDFDIHLLPWASVAACISDNSSKDDVLKQGRAFCFLPLPVKTGLSAHINGFFEVSSNRRGIWYVADMDRPGRIRSLWNRLLLEDVVAPSYAQLLLGVQQMLGPTDTYYSLWPTGSFEEPWNILVEHIYQNIIEFPVFYSNVKGGNWVSAREAFLHDSKLSKSKELEDALVQLGMPVVCLPNGLFNMLVTCVTGIKWKIVTPDSVRHYLRESKSASAINRSYRLMLLEYCLEDLVDTDVGIHAFGLPLLPLANGDFGLLSEPTNGISYFICNDLEYALLHNLSDRVINRKIPCNLLDRLTAVAKASGANLSFFSVPELLQVIPKIFPAEWKYKTKVLWDPGSCSDHPALSWFALFWRYLRDKCAELSLFDDWPILPSTSGHLYRPSRHLKFLNAENLSDKMQHVLIKMGCKILDRSHDIQHPDLSNYVCDADVEERDELRGFLLDPRWYISNCMDASNLCNCKRLPVYRVYGGEHSESIQFSDLVNPQKYLPPLDCSASLLSAEFISSSSNTEEEVLNRYIGIERMRKADFYKKHILDRVNLLDPDVRDNIIIMILRELPHLCVEDAHFKENLRNLDFIPTSSGSMRSPSVLYDPRNEELYALLEDCDSFPYGSVIAAQLLELRKNSEIVTDPMLRKELALAMPRIYSILMSILASDEIDIVKAVFEGCRWIWVGDGFATTEEVVLNGPLHLAPYMRVIPVDLAVFKELFLELGIREFLCPNDYANILSRMAIKEGSHPLDTREIRAAILIAQHLSKVQFTEDPVKIYLPDVSCRLLFATDLVYNDAPWLLDSEDPTSSFGSSSNMAFNASQTVHRFVHGNISNYVAEKLGVRSLRRILLAESADSMNLSLSGAAEAFGQHEALTTRLKHILEMYADGPGTLFELVQNAEGPNASKVIFLFDKTQHGTSSLLSPEMADWQGPALYCFNDSVFTPQDLYAISRIGQETKLEKPFAIGRFGLGFNCVYHFTDIPTFVSGENIVMFDPHACNLPGISPSHPGLRIKFAGRRIFEQFPDQFSPFLHFGCDLQHSFPGTLFRFPLRSANVASRSQIKKEGYTPDDVLALFHSFSEVVSETLLFLQNVKSISIFVKEGANSEMQVLHCGDKQYIGDPEGESNPNHQVFSLMYGKRHENINKAQFLNQLYKSVNIDLPWKCNKIVVSEKSTSGGSAHLWLTSECLGFI
ncbi:hypothetical protein RND71_034572 [Anisodus tanguticus]|uniref:Sacsin/Nov domain-containing protein n=1 Tax=Anisodus tanguticus TaxID=243964 RepID=A0AAE1UX51_9SOLA|nr:hypothetical protein RND71_034572 [Anisodus tanguticus]